VPELDQSAVVARRPGGGWPRILPVVEFLGMLAAGVALLLPPHTHEAKANELLFFYGFGGLWASARLLNEHLSATRWLVLSLIAVGLLLPRFLGVAPIDVGPSHDLPWLPYPFSVRLLQLAVAAGVGLTGLLGARALLAVAERARWAFGAAQLRRSSVFLYAASSIAFLASTGSPREATWTVLGAIVLYASAWSLTPTIIGLAAARPLALAVVTITSGALMGGGIVLLTRFFGIAPRLLLFLLVVALVSLGAIVLPGVVAAISALIVRAANRFGSLSTRFFLSGVFVMSVFIIFDADSVTGVGWSPTTHATAFVWPIRLRTEGVAPGEVRFTVFLDLAMFVVIAVALSQRLARDLGTARTQFRAIAGGELPRVSVISGREESGRLLERIAHFASQLSRREFLERLNAETRARTEQLGRATRDLTETNHQRLQAERFSAIAGIVATVSHELRNPVGQIAGNLPLIRSYVEVTARGVRELPAGKATASGLLRKTAQRLSDSGRDVEESARRAALILGDLNAVSATQLRALEEVDLPAVIERSVRLTLRAPEVRLECALEPVPKLTARAGELEQVVANLIENAVDAVTPTGTISVRLRRTGAAVLLEVEDDGPGMTADVLKRATEPFFTTKPTGKGTGLGLAIAASIVRAHQGTLELQSQEGSGTRVDVRLPLPEQARA
jgi:signal transduction histidine kinase